MIRVKLTLQTLQTLLHKICNISYPYWDSAFGTDLEYNEPRLIRPPSISQFDLLRHHPLDTPLTTVKQFRVFLGRIRRG